MLSIKKANNRKEVFKTKSVSVLRKTKYNGEKEQTGSSRLANGWEEQAETEMSGN